MLFSGNSAINYGPVIAYSLISNEDKKLSIVQYRCLHFIVQDYIYTSDTLQLKSREIGKVGTDLHGHPVQLSAQHYPCHHNPPNHITRPRCLFNTSRDSHSTTPVGKLFQSLTTLTVKKISNTWISPVLA